MPKKPQNYQDLFADPNFLAGIGQIVSGAMGAGSQGLAIGEANRFRQRQELEEEELQQRKSFQERQISLDEQQLEAQQTNQYLKAIEAREDDYNKRKVAALKDVQVTVDAMEPTDYQKLPENLPKILEPYQLRPADIQQISSNALGRIQSKDWTSFDTATGQRNVPPETPTAVFMTRKEAILAEQQFKKELAAREREGEALRKTNRAELKEALKAATRAGRSAELLPDLDENLISRVEAQGIVSGEQAIMAKEEGQRKLLEQQIATSAALADRALRAGEGAKLKADEKESLADAVMRAPQLLDRIGAEGVKQIAPLLVAKGFDTAAFGKPMGADALVRIAESQHALNSLKELRVLMEQNKDYIGPISGWQTLNPYSDARKIQANMKASAQRVGKAMEGGVLRAEDTKKYADILAGIFDEPSTAFYKVDSAIKDIDGLVRTFIETQGAGGRNVEGFKETKGAQTDIKVVDFTWDPKAKKAKKK